MCDPARMNIYQDIWAQVQQAYNGRFIVSERGLQAVLYGELQTHLRDVHVVVEPTWNMANGTQKIPDLVIVAGGEIADIFELKFVPHDNAIWQNNIAALHAHVVGNPQYPVQLTPQTGQWAAPLPVRADCCLHFVAVAQHYAEAVQPPLPGANGINHWFGRVGGVGEWDIHFA